MAAPAEVPRLVPDGPGKAGLDSVPWEKLLCSHCVEVGCSLSGMQSRMLMRCPDSFILCLSDGRVWDS